VKCVQRRELCLFAYINYLAVEDHVQLF